jgi:hypothetical protein
MGEEGWRAYEPVSMQFEDSQPVPFFVAKIQKVLAVQVIAT